jgi:uncharacterized protein (DUF433 family)
MTIETGNRHIVRDPDILGGEPIVRGTRVPVRAIAETWRTGVGAEEIQAHFPHLTQAQVFQALAYFSDNRDEILEHIARNTERAPATD